MKVTQVINDNVSISQLGMGENNKTLERVTDLHKTSTTMHHHHVLHQKTYKNNGIQITTHVLTLWAGATNRIHGL